MPEKFKDADSLRVARGGVSPLVLAKAMVAVLLLLWLANSLAHLFWRLMPAPAEQAVAPAVANSVFAPTPKQLAPPVDIAALKAIALFGKESPPEGVAEVAPVVVETKVEETRLNLSLVGSFANTDAEQAYAIIASGKKQALYRVREEIDGLANVKLMRVFTDKVILDNRGKQEALYMYPEGEPLSSGSATNASVLQRLEGRPSGGPQPVTASKALSGISDRARLEKISDAIRFTRKTQSGKMVGFRVLPGRNRGAFEQTGLKLNDVVTAIDGKALDNLKAANQIYQEKRNATQASLTVIRGDEELAIDIDLNNINLN
ncbi:MAG: type II secretion system protein GspC [Cellvibrionaceae bacterium]|nr:type II secretion system protein GspC [Cellvibrionaceae bacterium]